MKLSKAACYFFVVLMIDGTERVNGFRSESSITTSNSPENDEKKVLNIAEIIGKIISVTGEICVRLDPALILIDKTECFQYEISNITDNLYTIYVEAIRSNDTDNLPNLFYFTEKFDEFYPIDYYLFWKSIDLLLGRITGEQFAYFIDIVENVIELDLTSTYYRSLAKKAYRILYDMDEDFEMNSANLQIFSWHPFRTNIIGFVLYENGSFAEVYSSNDIDLRDVRMAGYVPNEFLRELTADLPEEQARMRILMTFTRKSAKFINYFEIVADVDELIGITIPGYCKNNDLPMLMAYFGHGTWIEFGSEYVDSLVDFDWYECVLNRTSFFGKSYESAKKKYCMASTLNAISFEQSVSDRWIYPKKFCMDEELQIPMAYCNISGSYSLLKDNANCASFQSSNETMELYRLLRNCAMKGELAARSFSNYTAEDIKELVDIKLYFEIFICLRMTDASARQIQVFCDVFDKSLEILSGRTQEYRNIRYVSIFLLYFVFGLPSNYLNEILHQPNYAYQRISPVQNTYKGAILVRGNMHQITQDMSFPDYVNDAGVEAAVYYTEGNDQNQISDIDSFLVSNYPAEVDIFFIYDNHLVASEDYRCKSRIIAIHHFAHHSENFNFTVYLKAIDERGQGYWTTVTSETRKMKLIFLRESLRNKTREVVVFQENVFTILESVSDQSPSVKSRGSAFLLISVHLLFYYVV